MISRVRTLARSTQAFLNRHSGYVNVAVAVFVTAIFVGLGPCVYSFTAKPGSRAIEAPKQSEVRVLQEGVLCIEGRCEPALLASGRLAQDFRELLDRRIEAAAGQPLWLCLQSGGGDHMNALMPQLPANVSTCVAKVVYPNGRIREGECDSTCVWVWMAGHRRELFEFATLGVHDPWSVYNCECWPVNAVSAWMANERHEAADTARLQPSDPDLARRRELRRLGGGKAPWEVHSIGTTDAQRLGLQPGPARQATFYLPGAPRPSGMVGT